MKNPQQPADDAQPRRSIKVHIDTLVLHGFAAGDRYGIARGVEQEVARLLAEQGLPSRLKAIELHRLAGGAINAKPSAKAEATGTQIGQRVHASISRAVRESGK